MSNSTESPQRGETATREAASRSEQHATITLIRHGEPDWTPDGGVAVGDPDLTPFGHLQASATARELANTRFDALYVSPYRRAQRTAAELAVATGLEPVTIDGLAEVQVAVDGFSSDEADRYFTEGARRPLAEHWQGWPGAESFHDFHARITSGIDEILERHHCHPYQEHDFRVWDVPEPGPSIAIVAHCGTNAVAITHLLDIRSVPWEWVRFDTGLAAFSTVQARPIGPKNHVWTLRNFNREAHLHRAGLK
ncbi:MAG: histidine phosphatase family protein [Myxococcota bacterium]